MTRAVLSLLVCVLALAIGLETARQCSRNHERAARLDKLKRECERLVAECGALEARLLEADFAFRETLREDREDREDRGEPRTPAQ